MHVCLRACLPADVRLWSRQTKPNHLARDAVQHWVQLHGRNAEPAAAAAGSGGASGITSNDEVHSQPLPAVSSSSSSARGRPEQQPSLVTATQPAAAAEGSVPAPAPAAQPLGVSSPALAILSSSSNAGRLSFMEAYRIIYTPPPSCTRGVGCMLLQVRWPLTRCIEGLNNCTQTQTLL